MIQIGWFDSSEDVVYNIYYLARCWQVETFVTKGEAGNDDLERRWEMRKVVQLGIKVSSEDRQ